MICLIARDRRQGERGAQEEDERRGGNGRQLDCGPTGHGEGVPGVVTNWHFSRSFHFYFTALTLVVIVHSLAQTQTYIP